MAKNYYVILGIRADASPEDVKAAFRRRALELHPDRSGLGSGPFQEVQEAYSVLADPERRRRYDREHPSLTARRPSSAPPSEPLVTGSPGGEPFRPVEPVASFRETPFAESFETHRSPFDELFERFWGDFEAISRPKSEQPESLTVELGLTGEQARQGGQVRLWIPARATCPACGGHGALGPRECWRCEGHGALTTEYSIDVDYPGGLRDGYVMRISLAQYGIENLYLTILFRVG